VLVGLDGGENGNVIGEGRNAAVSGRQEEEKKRKRKKSKIFSID